MEKILKEEMDNLFNVGLGNQFDFVGFYDDGNGFYIVDRTDGQTYTVDYPADTKAEAIELIFEKVEDMIDDEHNRIIDRCNEIAEVSNEEINEEELHERLEEIAKKALYSLQRYDLKKYFGDMELRVAEAKHDRLVAKYNLKHEEYLQFNYYV